MATRRTPKGKRVGRRPSLDEAMVTILIQNVSLGVPVGQAAILSGIAPSTWHLWRSKGEDEIRRRARLDPDDPPNPDHAVYAEFVERLAKARAEVAQRNVALLARAARGGDLAEKITRTGRDGTVEVTERFTSPQWQAAKFLLEKSFPGEFGQSAMQLEILPVEASASAGVERADEDSLAVRIAQHAVRLQEIEASRPVEGDVIEDGVVEPD